MNNGVIKFVDQNEMHGKLTDHMQNVSEELFDSVSERRAALYSKCTYRLIFEPGYNENNVLEDIRYMDDVYIVGEVRHAHEGIKLLTTGGRMVEMSAQGWNHFKP